MSLMHRTSKAFARIRADKDANNHSHKYMMYRLSGMGPTDAYLASRGEVSRLSKKGAKILAQGTEQTAREMVAAGMY